MKNRLILIGLFAAFFAPLLIALLLHSEWIDWQAPPDRSHGILIDPVVPIGAFELADAQGQIRGPSDLTGRWWLILVQPDHCKRDCLARLELMRRIRLAQDRHRLEVGLMLITEGVLSELEIDSVELLDPTFMIFQSDAGGALIRRFPAVENGAFYIVDPDTNIMERFQPDADPTGIRKDLDRLLKWTIRE
ncbi:MAG: hypothetical protein LC637_00400 [Xanthomonadaceae bacterium]|nr:hypothetical protein [Xanthomonadaceae bacterium]